MKRWVIVEIHENKTKTIISDLTECGDYEILFNVKQKALDASDRFSRVRIKSEFTVVELEIS